MLSLLTKYQCLTMPGTGLKVCGGMVLLVCKPIIVVIFDPNEDFAAT